MQLPDVLPVVLIHGGLFDDMTPAEFWVDTGVAAALNAAHITFIAPQRPAKPVSWAEEVDAIAKAIDAAGFETVALIGASHGCSAAARFAIDHPNKVSRLLLAWPATAGDQMTDGLLRVVIEDAYDASTADQLLAAETLWGVTDDELGSLAMPVIVFPSMPANHAHQRETATRLLQAQPAAIAAGGGPEPLDKQFGEFRDAFVKVVSIIAIVEPDD